MPLRTSALRALGAHLNVYAIESVVDELAALAGADPVEYRLGLLSDERARAVLRGRRGAGRLGRRADRGRTSGSASGSPATRTAARTARWSPRSRRRRSVRVRRLTIAVDVGLVVNPDGVVNQIEGGALQALSWTTKEQVRFDARTVTSRTWEEYPILTFSEVPPVDVVLLDRPGSPRWARGRPRSARPRRRSATRCPRRPALRVRTLPLTPENVVAAMEA